MPSPFDNSKVVENFCEELVLNGYLFISEEEDLTLNEYFKKSLITHACERHNLRHVVLEKHSIQYVSNALETSNTLIELQLSDENRFSSEYILNLIIKDPKIIIWIPKKMPKVLEEGTKLLGLFNNGQKLIPKLSNKDKIQFFLNLLKDVFPDTDQEEFDFLLEEKKLHGVSIDHLICYLELIKSLHKENNTITISNLKDLGAINNSVENHGREFERSFSIRFPNFSLGNLIQLFLIKKKDDTIDQIKLSVQRIKESLNDSTSLIDEVIEFIGSSSFKMFISSSSHSHNILELNKPLLIHWSFYMNVIYQERFESNLYLQISENAKLYNKGSGKLLNQAQCIEASALISSKSFNKNWASKYNNEFEQTKKFIELSIDYNKDYETSQEKKRKMQIKRAKNTALIVSAAFIVSMILALFSFSSLQRAQEATSIAIQNAERADQNANRALEEESKANRAKERAEELAELSRKNEERAELSRALAQKSAEDARLSEIQATKAKMQTEKALKDAINSREIAEIERKKSDQQSKQEKARSLSLSALQLYANNQIVQGLELAKEAYDINIKNNGFNTQSDILYALFKGHNLLVQKTLKTGSNIKTIKFSNGGDFLGVLYVNHRLQIFKTDEELSYLNLKLDLKNISSFRFQEDKTVLFTEGNDLKAIMLKNVDESRDNFPLSTIISEKYPIKLCETRDIFLTSTNGLIKLNYNKREVLNVIDSELNLANLIQFSDHQFVSYKEGKINILEDQNNRMYEKFSFNFMEKVVSISELFLGNLLAVGFDDGTLRILDISEPKVVSENKVHRSKISSIRVSSKMNQTMIISTSFDSEFKLFVADENSWKTGTYTTINNFSNHKTWIIDSFLFNDNQYATIDYDGTLKLWNLNINSILDENKN
jgi:hypothetical protein